MQRSPATLSVADLVDSRVVTAEGKKVGRIQEVQVTSGPAYRVIGFDLGARAWLYRLHVLVPVAKLLGTQPWVYTVPWDAVDRIEGFRVTLKPGREPQKRDPAAS